MSETGVADPGTDSGQRGGGQPNQPDRDPAQIPPGSGGGPEEGDPDQVGQQDPDKGLDR
jgi:hypothetical protein